MVVTTINRRLPTDDSRDCVSYKPCFVYRIFTCQTMKPFKTFWLERDSKRTTLDLHKCNANNTHIFWVNSWRLMLQISNNKIQVVACSSAFPFYLKWSQNYINIYKLFIRQERRARVLYATLLLHKVAYWTASNPVRLFV